MEVETRDWSPGVKTAESSREGEVSGRAGSGAEMQGAPFLSSFPGEPNRRKSHVLFCKSLQVS